MQKLIYATMLGILSTSVAFQGERLAFAGDNSIDGASADSQVTFQVLTMGSATGGENNLESIDDIDRHIFLVIGPGTFHFDALDGGQPGDTLKVRVMAWGASPAYQRVLAESPDSAELDYDIESIAVIYVNLRYAQAPNGFPAGYSWTAEHVVPLPSVRVPFAPAN